MSVVELKPKVEYAFHGDVIKLNTRDYERWKKVFHAIPDFDAELFKLDVFYRENEVENWFVRASAALGKSHQQWMSEIRGASQLRGFDIWSEEMKRLRGEGLEGATRRPADLTRVDIIRLVDGGYLSAESAARLGVRR